MQWMPIANLGSEMRGMRWLTVPEFASSRCREIYYRVAPEADLTKRWSRPRAPYYAAFHDFNPSSVATLDYAKFFSLSRDAVIRVYDETGNVIETHEHAGEFKEV